MYSCFEVSKQYDFVVKFSHIEEKVPRVGANGYVCLTKDRPCSVNNEITSVEDGAFRLNKGVGKKTVWLTRAPLRQLEN